MNDGRRVTLFEFHLLDCFVLIFLVVQNTNFVVFWLNTVILYIDSTRLQITRIAAYTLAPVPPCSQSPFCRFLLDTLTCARTHHHTCVTIGGVALRHKVPAALRQGCRRRPFSLQSRRPAPGYGQAEVGGGGRPLRVRGGPAPGRWASPTTPPAATTWTRACCAPWSSRWAKAPRRSQSSRRLWAAALQARQRGTCASPVTDRCPTRRELSGDRLGGLSTAAAARSVQAQSCTPTAAQRALCAGGLTLQPAARALRAEPVLDQGGCPLNAQRSPPREP